jgi:hypothetical protein
MKFGSAIPNDEFRHESAADPDYREVYRLAEAGFKCRQFPQRTSPEQTSCYPESPRWDFYGVRM